MHPQVLQWQYNWQQQCGVGYTGRMGWQEGQVKRLAAELVDNLSSMGNLAAAATVAIQYLADVDNGVTLLTQAREWREALRVAYK